MATTPYMTLSLPTVGTTAGPAWATAINAALSLVDSHDHSAGKGVPVRTSGLYVDSGLSFNGFDVTALRSVRFSSGTVLSLPTDLSCLFVSGGELYYNDGIGNHVQLTAGGALNAGSIGAIGGDYGTSGASEFYTSASKLFSFESSAGVKAHAALGNLYLYEAVASGKYVRLKVPAGLAANYDLTLPAALPAATKILTLDNTGAIAATYGATSAAAADAYVIRDASGRAKIADPSAADDIDTKGARDAATAAAIAAIAPVVLTLTPGANWADPGNGAYLVKQGSIAVLTIGMVAGTGAGWTSIMLLPAGGRPTHANFQFPATVLQASTGDIYNVLCNLGSAISITYWKPLGGANWTTTPPFSPALTDQFHIHAAYPVV